MSNETDRNQQALDLHRSGYRVIAWPFGFTITNGLDSQFFNKAELTPSTILALQAVAQKPGGKSTGKSKSHSRSSKRRPAAAMALKSMAYGAMAELVERVNGEKETAA